MKISKNKIVKNNKILRMITLLFLIFIGWRLYNITEDDNKVPEDNPISSGDSVVWSNMEKINNYSNVINYKYALKLRSTKNLRLKDLAFSFYEDINLQSDYNPQGLCMTEQYLILTFYSADKDTLGKVMIHDKETGEHMISLAMDAKSHLGGIAYDGKNIWVCNSSNMSIERISYEFICKVIKLHRGKTLDIRNMIEGYRVNLIPSCITFYNNQLWVATHAKLTNSQMISYSFDSQRNQLVFESIYHIPAKVQGIAFDERGRVLLSTSYGRKKSSYLKIYSSIQEMSKNVDKYETSIEMPPCSEGIDIKNQRIYIMFESAGKKYLEGTDGNGKSIAPLDKILIIELS